MHVAVRAVVADHRVPPANLDIPLRVHGREPVVREELDRPRVVFVLGFLRLANGFYGAHVERFEGGAVFVRVHDYVHVAPEIEVEVVVDGFAEVEVLELSEGLEGRHGDDIDAEDFGQSVVVHVEWVLGAQFSVLVRVECPRVLHHVYILRRPARCDVTHYYLLQQWPEAREPDVKPRLFWDMFLWWLVPGWHWR